MFLRTLLLTCAVIAPGYQSLARKIDPCPCNINTHCDPVTTWKNSTREVLMVSDGTSDTSKWNWETVTTVVADGSNTGSGLMCESHRRGIKYGITASIPVPDNVTAAGALTEWLTNPTFSNWTEDLKQKLTKQFADVVVLDLLDLVGGCGFSSSHVTPIKDIVNKVVTAARSVSYIRNDHVKVLCVMPWKPPCFDNDCHLSADVATYCDALVLSPDSYATFCNMACMARATVPITKLMIGIDEYLGARVSPTQLIVGIPWHGYNYTCDIQPQVPDRDLKHICYLPHKNNSNECDVLNSRTRVSLGQFQKEHPGWFNSDPSPSLAYIAPNHPTTLPKTNTTPEIMTHQIWYENVNSLEKKYREVKDFKLRGLAIYTAEDLTYTKLSKEQSTFNKEMWAWLLHTIFTNADETVERPTFDYAGTVAGVGVGMFVFGTVAGLLIACFIFRRRQTKRPPFQKDAMQDEYHDDETL